MKIKEMAFALLVALVGITSSIRTLDAQSVRFEWPDTTVDFSTYTSIYECMAAVARLREMSKIQEYHTTRIELDTISFDPELELWRSAPPILGETARTCLNSAEDLSSAPNEAWEGLTQLFLYAGMEDSARAVVERRLAAIAPDSVEEFKDLLIRVIFIYNGGGTLEIRPPLGDLGDNIVLDHVEKLSNFRDRLQIYTQMLVTGGVQLASDDDDSPGATRTRRLLARIQAQLESASQEELQALADQGGEIGLTPADMKKRLEGMATFFVGQKLLLDSLRVSTATYAKVMRETYSQGFGQPPELYLHGRPLGERAPTLEGDIWLGCERDPCDSYPRSGRISVVWFYDRERAKCRWPTRGPTALMLGTNCAGTAIRLRRLQERFPELDIVVVTETIGRDSWVKEGVTPEREAQLVRQWLDSFGLERAVLTMSETPGWRLPEPDGRRINRTIANRTNYSFNGSWSEADMRQNGAFLLVDRDGYIVTTSRFDRYSERDFTEFVEILFERDRPAK